MWRDILDDSDILLDAKTLTCGKGSHVESTSIPHRDRIDKRVASRNRISGRIVVSLVPEFHHLHSQAIVRRGMHDSQR